MHGFRPVSLLLIGAVLGFSAGCEQERRVPYIVPKLQNWPQPYQGKAGLQLHVFSAGALDVLEAALLKGGSLTQRRQLPVLAYVLKHPQQGLVVINTGLPHRFSEGDVDVGGLLGMTVDARLEPGQDLPSQMKAANLAPDKVRWVILSDLRLVNAGEVEAFPKARVVVSRIAHQNADQGSSESARPDFDDVESWKFVDFEDAKPVGTLRAAIDLFGDASCLIVDARGRTEGGVGVLLRLPGHAVFLADSLAPVPETLRYAASPASLDDADAWWDGIWRLKRFNDLEPALLVVPGHSDEALRNAPRKEIVVHGFESTSPNVRPTPTVGTFRLPGFR
jgi:glyoxylase-like metal-dependent hydrolase (beta-lactamase superfamily II)